MSDENKVASIDVHKKVLMVVVGSREGDALGPKGELERRRFGSGRTDGGVSAQARHEPRRSA